MDSRKRPAFWGWITATLSPNKSSRKGAAGCGDGVGCWLPASEHMRNREHVQQEAGSARAGPRSPERTLQRLAELQIPSQSFHVVSHGAFQLGCIMHPACMNQLTCELYSLRYAGSDANRGAERERGRERERERAQRKEAPGCMRHRFIAEKADASPGAPGDMAQQQTGPAGCRACRQPASRRTAHTLVCGTCGRPPAGGVLCTCQQDSKSVHS